MRTWPLDIPSLAPVRAAASTLVRAKARVAAAQTTIGDEMSERRARLHRALLRGKWSGRLSSFAIVGLGVMQLLPLLDGPPATERATPKAGHKHTAAAKPRSAPRAALTTAQANMQPSKPVPVAVAPVAPSQMPVRKLQGSLDSALLDNDPSTRSRPVGPGSDSGGAASLTQASASPSTWRVVPTRRMDLAGHVIDSSTPDTMGPGKRNDGIRPTEAPVDAAPARTMAAVAPPAPVTAARAETRSTDASPAGQTRTPAASANTDAMIADAKQSDAKASAGKNTAPKSVTTKSEDKPLPVPPASAPTEQAADQWSDAEVGEARAECARLVTGLTLEGDEAAPVRNGACGTPAPITLKRAGGAMTEFSPAVLVNCRMAAALNGWINDTLQPAAQASFGEPVVRILTASSYVCRNRYGQAQAPISEHAFANALDMSGFVLRDGRVVKVVDGWGPTARDLAAREQAAKNAQAAAGGKEAPATAPSPVTKTSTGATEAKTSKKHGAAHAATLAEGKDADTNRASAEARFLHALHKGACGPFGTVLGPEANDAHRDHLHVDLKQRKHAAICE